MTERECSQLERGYRRFLRFYPPSFRVEHEEEMIAVLIHGADPGQRRPKPGEAANLVRHGLRQRLAALAARIPGRWEREHARAMFPIRIGIALWLCLLSGLLIGYHRGQWLLVLLVPAILAHVYLAYRIRPGADRHAT